jgi:DNA polymerase-3 subunit alpha
LEQLTLLVRAGALGFTGETKKALLWKAHFVLGHAPPPVATAKLFGRPQGSLPELPPLHNDPYDDAFDELELFGFTLGDPFSLLRNEAEVEPLLAAELPGLIGQRVSITGYLVTAKLTSTTKREQMYFGTFLDRAGDWLDTVHFPDIARRYPFRGRGVYRIFGKVVEEFDCISIEVAEMERLALVSRE